MVFKSPLLLPSPYTRSSSPYGSNSNFFRHNKRNPIITKIYSYNKSPKLLSQLSIEEEKDAFKKS